MSEKKYVDPEKRAKQSQKQGALQIGHTQLLTFSKNKKKKLSNSFQPTTKQTGQDSTTPDTNEVQPSLFLKKIT